MDSRLVKRAQDGDERAFEALVVAVHPTLFRVGFGITRDAESAEDAAQRALLDAWRFLGRLRDRSAFLPWSLSFLVPALRKAVEAKGQAPVEPADPEGTPSRDPFGTVVDRDQLSRAFSRLSFDDRAALVLRYRADLDAGAVATALGVRTAEAEKRMAAALRALSAAIDSDPTSTRELVPQAEGA
jgi:RNA polymerase sigma-70 factor (ECF subfamily)